MTTSNSKQNKRNVVVFQAPSSLTQKARVFAEENMVSVSAIYRQALHQYLYPQKSENPPEQRGINEVIRV